MSKEMIARNGDTLAALNARKAEIEPRLRELERELLEAEARLKPLRELVREKRDERANVSCRLNIWWNQYHEKYGPPRDPPRPNGGIHGEPTP